MVGLGFTLENTRNARILVRKVKTAHKKMEKYK